MTGRDATYRDLIDAAITAAARGSFAMLRHRFTDPTQGRDAVAAYRDLLAAINTHLNYLIPASRTGAAGTPAPGMVIGRAGARPGASAAEPVAAQIARTVVLLAQRAERSTQPGGLTALAEAARHWRQAATDLRAAQELLDTHRTATLRWRTPDAWLLDHPQPQAAAAEALAGVLRTIAGTGQILALRAHEVDASIACADLISPAPLRIVAASLTAHARSSGGIPALDELSLARTTPRSISATGPLDAAVQAFGELRQDAWEHARSPQPSIRTIGVYAALAAVVYQHGAVIAAAALTHHDQSADTAGDPTTSAGLRRTARLSAEASRSWRQIYRMCSGLQATTPTQARTHELLVTVRADLEALTRNNDGWRPANQIIPNTTAAGQLLTHVQQLMAPLEEISAWHTTVMSRLIAAGQIYIPAADLDREQVSDDPALATARLARKTVPLPARQSNDLIQAFTLADKATWAVANARQRRGTFDCDTRPGLSAMRAIHRAAGSPSAGL